MGARYRTEQQGLDKNGKMKYRTLSNRLVVSNSGSIAAEDLTFDVAGLDGAQLHFDPPKEPVTIEPDSARDWVPIPIRSGAIQIDARWTEAGNPESRRWTIRI